MEFMSWDEFQQNEPAILADVCALLTERLRYASNYDSSRCTRGARTLKSPRFCARPGGRWWFTVLLRLSPAPMDGPSDSIFEHSAGNTDSRRSQATRISAIREKR